MSHASPVRSSQMTRASWHQHELRLTGSLQVTCRGPRGIGMNHASPVRFSQMTRASWHRHEGTPYVIVIRVPESRDCDSCVGYSRECGTRSHQVPHSRILVTLGAGTTASLRSNGSVFDRNDGFRRLSGFTTEAQERRTRGRGGRSRRQERRQRTRFLQADSSRWQ